MSLNVLETKSFFIFFLLSSCNPDHTGYQMIHFTAASYGFFIPDRPKRISGGEDQAQTVFSHLHQCPVSKLTFIITTKELSDLPQFIFVPGTFSPLFF
jgi:hypothetical protein